MSKELAKAPGFPALWAAASISHLGTMLGALSLTALLYLEATPSEMGLLAAATTAPALLIALLAGVWVDRLPRRSVMLFADFGRSVLLLTVPAAALLGSLYMEQLYLVAFAAGCLEVLFGLAYRSILPAMVAPGQLMDANARLRMGESVAESISPTIGGGVVQAVGGPILVLLDAISFLASGLLLGRIRTQSSEPRARNQPALREAMEGLRTATREPTLRAILGLSCTYGFFGSFLITLFALRVLRDLGLSPVALGLLAGAGGLGSFAGAGLAAPVTRRLGLGPTITVSYVLAVLFDLTIPLADGPAWVAFTILFGGQLLGSAFYVIENVSSMSLRQVVTPEVQLGRVNAIFLVANRGLRPAGALAAGFLAEEVGVQEALFVGVAGVICASLWLILSPLPRMKAAPTGD